MYGAGDVRVENVPDAQLVEPTDALVRVTRACDLRQRPLALQVDGADRGRPPDGPRVHRHRRGRRQPTCGRSSRATSSSSPFAWSDGTCVFCREGLQTSCLHGGCYGVADVDGGQGEAVRVPQADGTLVVLPVGEDDALMPSLLTLSDVMGTGHHAAVARQGRARQRRSPSSATARSACAA